MEWNESNYDVTKNSYMYEAYQCKKYGFVPDYARLDVLYHNGGIYLDTDIEVFQPFDDLLCDNSFFSADYEGSVNTGSGFGTVPFNPIIKSMMDVYEDKHFLKEDGTMALEPCQHYSNPVLKNYGFAITPKYQNINGNVIYPSEVFAPIGMYTGFKHFTDKTHSLHYGNYSWGSEEEKAGKERFKREIVSRLNQ